MHTNGPASATGAPYGLIVVAASAGGLAALATLLGRLPPSFPVPLAIVQHIHPRHPSTLPQILGRHTRLRVKEAESGDVPTAGVVYVGCPDAHLEIADNRVTLSDAAPERFLRPCADRLFASAAACGPTIAVILTGTGSDGSRGAGAVKASGGIVLAQDEATSAFFGMPRAAIRANVVDFVLPLSDIAAKLIDLTRAAA